MFRLDSSARIPEAEAYAGRFENFLGPRGARLLAVDAVEVEIAAGVPRSLVDGRASKPWAIRRSASMRREQPGDYWCVSAARSSTRRPRTA